VEVRQLMHASDDLNAFVEMFEIPPAGSGWLDGLRFAVKDLFDVAGRVTGCGNPTWRDTHPPAVANAVSVDQLLQAGAQCVGKTITDQLAFGLDGENYFYGTPLNPRAPDRVPGGSSSGSAAAVAAGIVDFALGTDTGGSVRVPAHNCGIWGMRPSHDRVSLAGVMPFAPTYDTVGILAGSAAVLDASMRVLLACQKPRPASVGTIHMVSEAWRASDPEVRDALREPVNALRRRYGDRVRETTLRDIDGDREAEGLEPWFDAFYVPQWAEIWSTLGSWVEEHRPEFGPRTQNNFDLAKGLDRTRLTNGIRQRERLFRALHEFLGPRDVLCMPTAPALAPRKGSLPMDRSKGSYYPRTVSVISIAGVGKLPQVSMPFASWQGVPVGLSLLTRHGEDAFLLDVITEVTGSLADTVSPGIVFDPQD